MNDKVSYVPMYDREIDVAQIMRDIKKKAAEAERLSINDAEGKADHSQFISLDDMKRELVRISDFIENTRLCAETHTEPGRIIPIKSCNWLARKAETVYKRIVRKSTRYLVEEQQAHNESMTACVKALREAQEQMLKIITAVEQNGASQQKLWMELSQRLDEQQDKQNSIEAQLKQCRNSLIKNNGRTQSSLKMYTDRLNGIEAELNRMDHKISEEKILSEELYIQFEDRFRGSEEEIKRRLTYYYEHFVKDIINIKDKDIILDLGCGRGEWLELLKDKGYIAKGIDNNQAMVDRCTSKKLDVRCQDMLDYLKQMKSESVKMITCFQVAEHLTIQQVSELIKEAYRVLQYHGILILEVPNCRNIEVGSMNFYQDPTHTRPLHSEYLRFLAEEYGFYETQIAMWKEEEINNWLDSVVSEDATNVRESAIVHTILESLKATMYVSPDYALIATK